MARLTELSGGAKQLRAKGDSARDQRNWQDAADHYTRYLDQQSDDAAIWVQLGHCQKELGDRDAAERSYLRALSIEPMNADTQVQIGHVEKLNGRLEQALAWYRKALIIDPASGPAQHEVELVSALIAAAQSPAESAAAKWTAGSTGPLGNELEARLGAVVDQKVQTLADQIGAIKAVAVELQRVRRLVETLEGSVTELQTTVTSQAQALATTRESHAERLGALEAQAPGAQHSFPALLSHVADVNAHRAELERCRARIEAIEKHLDGSARP